jgi:hypothetical protein
VKRSISTLIALGLASACGGDNASADGESSGVMSGFTSVDDGDDDDDDSTDPDTSATDPDDSGSDSDDGSGVLTSGSDGGEPEPPGEDPELCDAGDESWAKRVLPAVQGRKPESIREVRILVQMIEQLDAQGEDGRRIVATGLASGDDYLDRWKQYVYEQLRVNVNSDRRNETCYDLFGAESNDTALAEHIRDNGPTVDYGTPFWLGDVVYSALLLDDVSPAYRADLFARLAAPDIAGNVSPQELEIMRRSTYGQSFEAAYLGRKTECLPCHRGDFAVTDVADDPEADRHWPIPGHFELAVYGPDAGQANEPMAHAIFRRAGFASGQGDFQQVGNDRPWGMYEVCGVFDFAAGAGSDILDEDAYMIEEYPQGATLMALDANMQEGFASLQSDGLVLEPDEAVADPTVGFAYLFSINFANKTWRELMGWPLVVANNFPRNQAQRDLLEQLTNSFADNHYSVRSLVTEIVTHPYFNQAPPDTCTASTPYHLPAIFNPFTKASTDPALRGNGVGDGLHRYSAMVLLDMTARAMWWERPQRFGAPDIQVPGLNCGAGAFPECDAGPAQVDFLRDTGVFLNDSESGFNGVDFNGLLHWEFQLAEGGDPGLGGACTGPLGEACAGNEDWIEQLVTEALDTPGATMLDVMIAVKDRVLTEPTLATEAEIDVIEQLTGVGLDEEVTDVGANQAEAAARRFAGLLLNTPQYLLDGVASPDQDPENDPALVVPGTGTAELCAYLGDLVLGNAYDWSCSAAGITISG